MRRTCRQTSLRNAVPYEEWLAEADGDFAWADFDENTAAGMCYTSGTTGNPKGVRLLAPLERAALARGGAARHARPVVARRRPAGGAAVPRQWLVASPSRRRWPAPRSSCPGAKLDGPSVYELLTGERVTISAAVPTVWLALLQHLEKTGTELPDLRRVVIGGSACPRAVTEKFRDRYDVEVMHAWGMTEMSPLGSVCSMKPEYGHLEGAAPGST